LILNLVDAADVNYIPAEIVDAALVTIHENIGGNRILLHCNQGQSRSPTIGLLYLLKFTDRLSGLDRDAAIDAFRSIYPPYNPARGMAEYARINGDRYCQDA
jgi:protein-tyrosine phosphatase